MRPLRFQWHLVPLFLRSRGLWDGVLASVINLVIMLRQGVVQYVNPNHLHLRGGGICHIPAPISNLEDMFKVQAVTWISKKVVEEPTQAIQVSFGC